MKFETPEINISKFNTDDIITTSSVGTDYTAKINAVNAVTKSKMGVIDTNIITFSF